MRKRRTAAPRRNAAHAPPAKGAALGRARASSIATEPLRELIDGYARSWNRKDIDALAGFYAADSAYLAPGHDIVSGTAAIRATLLPAVESVTDLEFEPCLGGRSGRLAYSVGRYRAAVITKTGERRSRRGKYVLVFRRDPDGRWRAVADAFS